MRTPRIILGIDDGFVAVETPYDEDFVRELKEGVAFRDRKWDPDDKRWWVTAELRDYAQGLVLHHFGSVEVVDEDGVCETISPGAHTRQEGLF